MKSLIEVLPPYLCNILVVDDVRIYNRALSEDEILRLYHENGWTGE